MTSDAPCAAEPPRPADQAARERFRESLDRNFSVIAPAGVGKTKAIVDRVVAIATGDPERAKEWLPRLVVVTYTNKAAEEMHQRARNAIIAAQVGLPILAQFNRAFFGTIHSFCVRLLRLHGHRCGLPSQFEPLEKDDELWAQFIRQLDRLAPDLPSDTVEAVCRLMPLDDLLRLARDIPEGLAPAAPETIPPPPPVSLKGVLQQTPQRKNSADTIARAQAAAVAWQEAWMRGDPFTPLPANASSSRDFVASWENAFGPLRHWLARASLAVAAELARAYRVYRRSRGALLFDDQVELAWEMLRDPETARHLRAERYCIMLDEAQDTDPTQFNILLELARAPMAAGVWLRDGGAPPEPGRFCMVGDPQQSIYGDRADLGWYERVRRELAASPHAEEIAFSVTFRCDRAIIDAVNRLMAPAFARAKGQVRYHPLQSRPGAADGQVVYWTPPSAEPGGVASATLSLGRQLADWLLAMGLDRLRARQWSDVAILCPRTRWIQGLAVGLREKGLGPQIHSERTVLADNPTYAWFAALLHVLSRSDHAFELVGVLREIYGYSDEALAWFAATREAPWLLDGKKTLNERAADPAVANELASIEATIHALAALAHEIDRMPLRDAVERIFQAVALRERLAALGRPDLAIDADLGALIACATEAEAQSRSLAAFADQLRETLNETVPARPIVTDAVQLSTLYKAKGLQWPVVILPLFFRAIGEPKTYPALMRAGPGEWPHVALSKDDFRSVQEQVEQKRRQELQRLLYVGLTRAQRTLVVTDDHLLFPRKRPNRSFADLLGMIGDDGSRVYSPVLNECPAELTAEPALHTAPRQPSLAPEAVPAASLIERVIARVAAVPKRILPYELGEAEAKAERALLQVDEERSADAEAARRYGTWWHERAESMPWSAPRLAQERHWRDALATCPNPERGAAESRLLLDSELAARLREPDLVYRREIPVFWRRDAHSCVEGIVDLAVWQPARSAWLIVDWKTNVIRPEEGDHLRSIYTPQLNAYAAAVFALKQQPVEAGVYSTATGLWIPCVQFA